METGMNATVPCTITWSLSKDQGGSIGHLRVVVLCLTLHSHPRQRRTRMNPR